VRINGARLWVATGQVAAPPAVVRDWYRERYRARGKAFDTLADWLKRVAPLERPSNTLNQLTFGNDDWGGIVLLDPGESVDSAPDLVAKMRKLVETGDVGALGQIRYIQWERTARGGTELFTLTTDTQFPLGKVFAAGDADVDGTDVPGVPRPPGARRILTMEEQGAPLKLRVYRARGTVGEMRSYYEREMAQRGWRLDSVFEHRSKPRSRDTMRFERKGEEVFIALGLGKTDDDVRVRVITQQN
jgi:hypothetical protein